MVRWSEVGWKNSCWRRVAGKSIWQGGMKEAAENGRELCFAHVNGMNEWSKLNFIYLRVWRQKRVGLKHFMLAGTKINTILVSFWRTKCLRDLDSVPVEIQKNHQLIYLLIYNFIWLLSLSFYMHSYCYVFIIIIIIIIIM
jgi:hypothetical protein